MVGGESVWNMGEQSQGTTVHHGAKAEGCKTHCFNMYGVAKHAEDTPGWSRQGTTPANDVAA